jgi:hypothetical protein
LDKRNRFSEELGARTHPVCWFAILEDSAVDPRPDWRRNRWNLFVTTCANPKLLAQGPYRWNGSRVPGGGRI